MCLSQKYVEVSSIQRTFTEANRYQVSYPSTLPNATYIRKAAFLK